MEPSPPPAHICLVTTRAPCRLVIRASTPGAAVAWPMLVTSPCPWSFGQPWEIPKLHAHVHFMTEPGPWIRLAPCNRQLYLLQIEAA